jgi:hypothetical protein
VADSQTGAETGEEEEELGGEVHCEHNGLGHFAKMGAFKRQGVCSGEAKMVCRALVMVGECFLQTVL